MAFLSLSELQRQLNPEQFRAVSSLDGAFLIIAGAGSGKTRVITYRIAHMLQSGIPQNQILALTFTNKAAAEMASRVKSLTEKKLQNLTISTFHSFGVRILRNEIEALDYRKNFSIYDETDKIALIKESARELKFSQDTIDTYKVAHLFSEIKTKRKTWEHANDAYKELYESYEQGLQLYNALDFDDLIMLPIKIFSEHPDVLQKYRARYRYIMVDEFQDTSENQYELLHLLDCKNIAVVGDDDQSIYSWRGADYKNILRFEKDFPDVEEIRLEQNYRSTETILEAANGVISHNTNRKDKTLWSKSGAGGAIEIFMCENEADEAERIVESIQGISFEEKKHYDNFGILLRANSQSRAIEEALLNANIPYTMSGGTGFFERQEIKDIISYLRVVANENDDINMLRIINTPRRGIGRSTIALLNAVSKQKSCPLLTSVSVLMHDEKTSPAVKIALAEFAELLENARKSLLSHETNLSGRIAEFINEINYRDYLIGEFQKSEKLLRFKLHNIDAFIESVKNWEENPDTFEKGLFHFLNRITLLSHGETEDEKGKVNVMTIHASKGLEFPIVFIPGAEEGIIPHARSLDDDEQNIEEERRLFYVAITRAREKLFISSCRKRKRMQAVTECVPSRFLEEIPQKLVEVIETEETNKLSDDEMDARLLSITANLRRN